MSDNPKQLAGRKASKGYSKRFNQSILEDMDARRSQLVRESAARRVKFERSDPSREGSGEEAVGDD